MPARPTWMLDMGDGTWAVSCSRCQCSLYHGHSQRHANRVFNNHRCEPAVVAGRRRSLRGSR
jgi:hypothetical protein